MTVKDAIKNRFSTRGFEETPVTEEEINALLDAGVQAPTGCNFQEIHFTVVNGNNPLIAEVEAEKMRLRDAAVGPHNAFYEAPTIVLLSAKSELRWNQVDAGIAIQNMVLCAEELGLGTLIVGSIYDAMLGEKKEYFEKAFSIPEGYEFIIALGVGHTALKKEPHTYNKEAQVTFI